MTHPHPNRRFVPQAVLTRSGKINIAGASVNTVVRPVNTAGLKTTMNHPRPISNAYKKGYSQDTRPFNKYSANKNSIFNKKVNIVRVKDTTARDIAVDETSGILKTFITEIENQLDHKVKVIRCDNGTEFKNSVMNQFCEMKGIKREFSIARTPQQNGVAERRNRTLIEAAKTMLVLVIKPHTKKPYELIRGRTPLIDFMKPFGYPVTILNTRDNLGKFDGKADEVFFVGYSMVSKAMRVFNKRTRIVEETLNIRFLENAPNVTENGPDWLFDVDSLTISMNYVPVVAGNQTNGIEGTKDNIVTDKDGKDDQDTGSEFEKLLQLENQPNSTNSFNTVGTPVSVVGPSFTNDDPSLPVTAARTSEEHLFEHFFLSKMHLLFHMFQMCAEADLNNLETTMNVNPIPTTRINKDHPKDQIIGDFNSTIQTRRMTKISDEHTMICYINKQRRTNHKDDQNCLFAYFLSQNELKKVIQALEDPSWIEAKQEELL
ncbi:retrovirus-related pol polyprotein from transposon TNT 1-94 [Tanacetum coccineum]